MAKSDAYKKNDRVALAEDTKWRGFVSSIEPGYDAGDITLYSIQWDKSGIYRYLAEALIPEKEANERQAKLDAEKKSVDDKFKSMEKKDETVSNEKPTTP